jgi:hypothetical protein
VQSSDEMYASISVWIYRESIRIFILSLGTLLTATQAKKQHTNHPSLHWSDLAVAGMPWTISLTIHHLRMNWSCWVHVFLRQRSCCQNKADQNWNSSSTKYGATNIQSTNNHTNNTNSVWLVKADQMYSIHIVQCFTVCVRSSHSTQRIIRHQSLLAAALNCSHKSPSSYSSGPMSSGRFCSRLDKHQACSELASVTDCETSTNNNATKSKRIQVVNHSDNQSNSLYQSINLLLCWSSSFVSLKFNETAVWLFIVVSNEWWRWTRVFPWRKHRSRANSQPITWTTKLRVSVVQGYFGHQSDLIGPQWSICLSQRSYITATTQSSLSNLNVTNTLDQHDDHQASVSRFSDKYSNRVNT